MYKMCFLLNELLLIWGIDSTLWLKYWFNKIN